MSKKHDGHGQKKKLTKKEIKAMNHAKLMSSKGGAQTTNVVDLNAYRDQNKKAAQNFFEEGDSFTLLFFYA